MDPIEQINGDLIGNAAYLVALFSKQLGSESQLASQVINVVKNLQGLNSMDKIREGVKRNKLTEYMAISSSLFVDLISHAGNISLTKKILDSKLQVDKYIDKLLSPDKREETPTNNFKVKGKTVNIALAQKIDQSTGKDDLFIGKHQPKKPDVKKSPPNQHIA